MASALQSLPLSALQHYLFCPRQCALIHVEHEWSENSGTAEGRLMHEKAHSGQGESRPGVRITRSLEVRSARNALHGVCDVVEIYDNGNVVPVEYKRGRPKAHHADELQLCGQAMCLEETLGLPEGAITDGRLFYGKLQRRTTVALDTALRALTLETADKARAMIVAGRTPPATYTPRLCDRCSLIGLCQPRALRLKQGVERWFLRSLDNSLAK